LNSITKIALALLLASGIALPGEEKKDPAVNLVLEFYPSGSLISPNFPKMEIAEDGGSRDASGLFRYWSSLTSLSLGPGLDTSLAYFDLTLGGGALWHHAFLTDTGGIDRGGNFISPYLQAQVAARFKIGDSITLGPQVGLAYFFEPYWYGEGHLELSDSLGITPGVGFTFGRKFASLSTSLGYLIGSFDVQEKRDILMDEDELDFSGIVLQIGVLFRF
jgi:hypothetical protein